MTKRKTKEAPKVAPAKVTPLKSRPLNDELRNQIVYLATRNLYVDEIKVAGTNYYTQWWALFSLANATALNYWCCLPQNWQVTGYAQSHTHDLRINTPEMGGSGGDRFFEARLHDLRDFVKLPSNFHGFPYTNSYLCGVGRKAGLAKVYCTPYIEVPNKDCEALLSASNARDELIRKLRNAASTLRQLLGEVKTTHQLLEVWPEGERFIPHPPVPVPLSQSLSVDVAALTAALKAGGAM